MQNSQFASTVSAQLFSVLGYFFSVFFLQFLVLKVSLNPTKLFATYFVCLSFLECLYSHGFYNLASVADSHIAVFRKVGSAALLSGVCEMNKNLQYRRRGQWKKKLVNHCHIGLISL